MYDQAKIAYNTVFQADSSTLKSSKSTKKNIKKSLINIAFWLKYYNFVFAKRNGCF